MLAWILITSKMLLRGIINNKSVVGDVTIYMLSVGGGHNRQMSVRWLLPSIITIIEVLGGKLVCTGVFNWQIIC